MPKENESCATCAFNSTPGRDTMVICVGGSDFVPWDYWCPYFKHRKEVKAK